jgi:Acyltransferase family
VVVVHAATAYVIDIAWYYDMERTTSHLWDKLLGLPVLLAGLFGLGPLFLLGGMFAAASLARKGPRGFVDGRLLRLGVPLLLFVAAIDPLTDYLSDLPEDQRAGLWASLAPGSKVRDFGPLWFVAALLSFSLVYAAWRWRRPATGSGMVIRPRQLVIAAAVVAAGSFAVRLRWPRTGDTFLTLRWQEWPQGAMLFTLGCCGANAAGWVGSRWSGRAAAGRSPPPAWSPSACWWR